MPRVSMRCIQQGGIKGDEIKKKTAVELKLKEHFKHNMPGPHSVVGISDSPGGILRLSLVHYLAALLASFHNARH